ncbi:hypothetical protein AB0M23_28500 [Streptomyces sp. NPDC052077]|uniref:hypothetical protein n=1 Tax=Streptomyces sp. NPDC052077 TaxID=3154757 RepID=UPI00344044B3
MPQYSTEQNLRLAQKMLDQQGQITDLTKERDGAYRERAHLLAWLAGLHAPNAVLAPAIDIDDEDGWWLLFLTIAGRQLSWHIAPRDVALLNHVERVDVADPRAQWDGHTTEEKYARIAAWTAELAKRCGPACAEGHTYTGRCESARPRETAGPCARHPHAPVIGGMCGGCTQYPADMHTGPEQSR